MTDDTKALITRLEALTGPDREVDAEIAVASGEWRYDEDRGSIKRPRHFYVRTSGNKWPVAQHHLPRYTDSIDDALTLLPEGMWWIVGHMNGKSRARVGDEFEVPHATPAIALLIAIFKALKAWKADD